MITIDDVTAKIQADITAAQTALALHHFHPAASALARASLLARSMYAVQDGLGDKGIPVD